MAAFDRIRLLRLKKYLLCTLLILKRIKFAKQRRERKCRVRKIYLDRPEKGEYQLLVKDMQLFDRDYFFHCFRMSPALFKELLCLVASHISKKDTKLRQPISPSERLCVTLRYLVTGDAFVTIGASYRMSPVAISQIIPETCNALRKVLLENKYTDVPKTEKQWREIADGFYKSWNFPNLIGAIGRKHVLIQARPRSGSVYFNYKKTFSIVLMAVCDSKYRFTLVGIGDSGSQSDGTVFANSFLGQAIENQNIPKLAPLPNSESCLPFVFVGEDAFGLKENMMKPYPSQNRTLEEKVFDYQLSRARRIIENSFGIATARFRIFRRPINAKISTVKSMTKAIVGLYNFLLEKNHEGDNQYCPPNFIDREENDNVLLGE